MNKNYMKVKAVLNWILTFVGIYLLVHNCNPNTYIEVVNIAVSMLFILGSQGILNDIHYANKILNGESIYLGKTDNGRKVYISCDSPNNGDAQKTDTIMKH